MQHKKKKKKKDRNSKEVLKNNIYFIIIYTKYHFRHINYQPSSPLPTSPNHQKDQCQSSLIIQKTVATTATAAVSVPWVYELLELILNLSRANSIVSLHCIEFTLHGN